MDTCVLFAARGPPGPIFSVIDKVAFTLEKLLSEVNAIMTALKTYSAPNYIIVWSSRCGVLKSRLGNTIREKICSGPLSYSALSVVKSANRLITEIALYTEALTPHHRAEYQTVIISEITWAPIPSHIRRLLHCR